MRKLFMAMVLLAMGCVKTGHVRTVVPCEYSKCSGSYNGRFSAQVHVHADYADGSDPYDDDQTITITGVQIGPAVTLWGATAVEADDGSLFFDMNKPAYADFYGTTYSYQDEGTFTLADGGFIRVRFEFFDSNGGWLSKAGYVVTYTFGSATVVPPPSGAPAETLVAELPVIQKPYLFPLDIIKPSFMSVSAFNIIGKVEAPN